MRIHTDVIGTWEMISDAFTAEKEAGRIAQSVTFKVLRAVGSRSHAHAYEIQLEAYAPGEGRRYGNSGSYGRGRDWAATYDEWGWLLSALFRLDPGMVVGSVKYPVYDGRAHFDERTGLTYNPHELIDQIQRYDGDPYPYVIGRGGMLGRQGYGRNDGDGPFTSREYAEARQRFQNGQKQGNRYVKYLPRTVESVREFARLTPEAVAS